jgi:hypothetical protein
LHWIRVANALVSNAELAELADADYRALLDAVFDAEAKADRRSARRTSADVPGPEAQAPAPPSP